MGRPRSMETKALEDASSLMRGEVRSVESGRAAEDLFWWEAKPAHDDVMLEHRVGKAVDETALYAGSLKLEFLS